MANVKKKVHQRNDRQVVSMKEFKKSDKRTRYKDFEQEPDIKIQRKRRVEIIPKNTAQEQYVLALNNKANRIVFATGPAGTGKTMLAVLRAVEMLKDGDITKIIITRPAVSVENEQHGFLPGDLNKKMEPWTKPIFDILEEYWSPREIQGMIEEHVIEICPLGFMRGRTFKNCYIILDEAQNSTPTQMKMILTRLGENSFMAVTGDLDQSDHHRENGLLDLLERFRKYKPKMIALAEFTKAHIERDEVVKQVLSMYDE